MLNEFFGTWRSGLRSGRSSHPGPVTAFEEVSSTSMDGHVPQLSAASFTTPAERPMPGSARTPVAPVPVPHPKQIRDLFLGLTGKDVEVGPVDPVVPGRDPAVVAVFVTDKLATGAAGACDLPLAAYAGAALGLVPLPQAQEAIGSGVLPEDLTENFAEVVNVLASVFNGGSDAPHLKLYKVHGVGETLPTDVASCLGYVVRRLDLRVDVQGYGAGRLSSVSIG